MLSKSITYRLLGSILAFMANIGMSFWVEKSQLGLFFFYTNLFAILGVLMTMGMPNIVTRLCDSEDMARVSRYLLIASRKIVKNFVYLLFIMIAYILIFHGSNEILFLIITFAAVPFMCITSMLSALLRGIGEPVNAALPEAFVRPASFFTLVSIHHYFTSELNINVLAFYFFISWIACSTTFLKFYKQIASNLKFNSTNAKYNRDSYNKESRVIFYNYVLVTLMFFVDIAILKFLGGNEMVSEYRLPYLASSTLTIIVSAGNFQLAALVNNQQPDYEVKVLEYNQLRFKIAYLSVLSIIPLGFLCKLYADTISSAYSNFWSLFIIMSFFMLSYSHYGMASTFLNLTNRAAEITKASITIVILNIILNLLVFYMLQFSKLPPELGVAFVTGLLMFVYNRLLNFKIVNKQANA